MTASSVHLSGDQFDAAAREVYAAAKVLSAAFGGEYPAWWGAPDQ